MARPAGRKRNFSKFGFDIEAVRLIKEKALKEGKPLGDILEEIKIAQSEKQGDKNTSRKSHKQQTPPRFGISREEARELLRDKE